jgi:hypothetical protein
MNYLRQEKSLRDQEPYLRDFATIADRVVACEGAPIGELPLLLGGSARNGAGTPLGTTRFSEAERRETVSR